MRIAHLLYAKGIAGAEKYLLDLLPALNRLGVDARLLCICAPGDIKVFEAYCREMNSKGVPTVLLTGKKNTFLSLASKINSYLKTENISVLHSHLINSDILAVLVKSLYNSKIFLVSSKHGYDENYLVKYSVNEKISADRNYYYYVTKFLLSRINRNLAVSKAISELYYNIGLAAEPYHYIHHGVAPIAASARNGDSKFRFSPQQLIMVGRLEKMKGHQYLIDALPLVAKEFPGFKLLIIGEGTEKNNLVNHVNRLGLEANVNFLGFQADPYSYISNSEVIILPSLFEPFGLVYIESFALKVPVVAFDVQATNEIIVNNETGILVPKYDSAGLAEKIIHLLKSPAERLRITENAFSRYLEYYTIERMASDTSRWYKSLQID